MMFLGWIFWIIVIVLVLRLIFGTRYGGGGNKAIDIAKERYAKGEITKKEFEEIKKNLEE